MKSDSNKKVLMLSPLPPPAGGISTWTKLVVDHGIPGGWNVSVVDMRLLGKRTIYGDKIDIGSEIKRTLKIFTRLFKGLLDNKVKVVHINTPCSTYGMVRDLLCCAAVRLFRRKLIIQCHCNMPYMINNKIAEMLYHAITHLANKVLVLNRDSQYLNNTISNKNAEILPNFLDDKFIPFNGKQKPQIADKMHTILFVGGVCWEKGCDLIIKAAEKLPDFKFRLVGYVNEGMRDIKIPSNVLLLDELPYESVKKELHSADVFLFPSITEGFPYAVVEAMAYGLPIVASRVGAIPDMIEDKGGILISPGDEAGLIEALKSLEHDAVRRRNMAEWNLNKVRTQYTCDTVLRNLAEIYIELVS